MEAVDLNILGTTELAQRWHTSRSHVHHLVKSPAIGKAKQLACGRVWTLSQVEAYEEWRMANGLGRVQDTVPRKKKPKPES